MSNFFIQSSLIITFSNYSDAYLGIITIVSGRKWFCAGGADKRVL